MHYYISNIYKSNKLWILHQVIAHKEILNVLYFGSWTIGSWIHFFYFFKQYVLRLERLLEIVKSKKCVLIIVEFALFIHSISPLLTCYIRSYHWKIVIRHFAVIINCSVSAIFLVSSHFKVSRIIYRKKLRLVLTSYSIVMLIIRALDLEPHQTFRTSLGCEKLRLFLYIVVWEKLFINLLQILVVIQIFL